MRQNGTGTCVVAERKQETKDGRGGAECEGRSRPGRTQRWHPRPAWSWLSLVPSGGGIVIHSRTTWGLQHALVDLTVMVLTRGPRHAVIYNLSETRV